MAFFHMAHTAANLFLNRLIIRHAHTLYHSRILHFAAGQKGGQCRREPEHPHAFQNGRADRYPSDSPLHHLPPLAAPKHISKNQRCRQNHHNSQRNPAERISPANIAVGRRCQAARKLIVHTREGRKHHGQHHGKYRNNHQKHHRRVCNRIFQLSGYGTLIRIIPGQPKQHVLHASRGFSRSNHFDGILRKNPRGFHSGRQASSLLRLLLHDSKPLLQNTSPSTLLHQKHHGLIHLNARLHHHRHALAKCAYSKIVQLFVPHICLTLNNIWNPYSFLRPLRTHRLLLPLKMSDPAYSTHQPSPNIPR